MKVRLYGSLLAAGMLSFTSLASLVDAPWAPDGSLGTAEQNLYQVLGFNNNAALNSAILNQSGGAFTDWTVPVNTAATYSSLLLELAGNADNNEFGIYQIGNTANRLQIFTGAQSANLDPGAAKQLSITTSLGDTKITVAGIGTIDIGSASSFGFYLDTHNTGTGSYYSVLADNTGAYSFQHVAAFNVTDTTYGQSPFPTAGQSGYVMGWEDLPYPATDYDYQDMVVSLTALPIPEPGTILAGAFLLLPFGASTLRTLRRKPLA